MPAAGAIRAGIGGRTNGRIANAGIIIETVAPAEMGAALAADAANKAKFGTVHLIIRGFLCTPFLAYGACVVFAMVAAGVPLGAAGLIFPAGYVTLSFLGLEMATGSFATMPIGMYAGTVTPFSWFATGPGLWRATCSEAYSSPGCSGSHLPTGGP